jgi:membrane protein
VTIDTRSRLDRIGDRVPPLAWLLRVQDRYTEMNGRALANSITLDGFLALFALVVLAAAVLGFVSANDQDITHRIVSSLGVKGSAEQIITDAVNTARRSRRLATVAGMLGLFVVGTGFAVAIANTYDAAWRVRGRGLVDRLVGLVWLAGALMIFVAAGYASSLWTSLPAVFGPLVVVITVGANTVGFLWTSSVLPNRRVPLRALVPAALAGGIALEVLKVLGGIVVPRLVANSSELYGAIGAVFALLVWLLVLGRLVVYVTVLEVVRWERGHGTTEVFVDAPTLPGR